MKTLASWLLALSDKARAAAYKLDPSLKPVDPGATARPKGAGGRPNEK